MNMITYLNFCFESDILEQLFSLSLRILSNGRFLNKFCSCNNNSNDNEIVDDDENGDELELTTFLVHFTF